jgi:hypothetical protein
VHCRSACAARSRAKRGQFIRDVSGSIMGNGWSAKELLLEGVAIYPSSGATFLID